MAPDIEVDSLAVEGELGDGGQGKVFSLPSDEVLKKYHDHLRGNLRAEVLSDLIQLAERLSCNGMPVEQWAAWPRARVAINGQVVGFVMPRVPEGYSIFVGGKLRLANLSYLATTPAPMWGPVRLPSDAQRVAILSRLAAVMESLHRHDLVIGDLSFNNILWSSDPVGVMLIDCDGVHPERGTSAMPQADTIDWGDPLGVSDPPDKDRDRYKLSLAIVRVLSRQLSATPADARRLALALPEEQMDPVLRLLDRAAGPRGTRPTATEWRVELSRREMRPVKPPVIRASSNTLPAKPELIVGGHGVREYRAVKPPPLPE